MGINRGPSMAYAIMRAGGFDGDTAAALLQDKRPVVGLAYRADADDALEILLRADADEAVARLRSGLVSHLDPERSAGTVITHGWHFAPTGGAAAPVGATEYWDGPLRVGRYGLHRSERALDAVMYLPTVVVRTEVMVRWCAFGGELMTGEREWAARERTAVWSADATLVLRNFAAWCVADLERQAWDMTTSQTMRQAALGRVWQTATLAAHENPVYAAVGAALHALGGPAHFRAGDRATVMARWRYSLHLESLLEKLSPGHEHEAEELRAAKEAEDARKAEDAREIQEGVLGLLGAAMRGIGRDTSR